MPKATFSEFIIQSSNCKKFEGNPDAIRVFDILSLDESIISMLDASIMHKSALAPCVDAIENFFDSCDEPLIDLNDDFTKQAIGLMIKKILQPFGFVPDKQKKLPSNSAKYFKSAHCYRVDPNIVPSMRVVKRIEEN